MGVSLCVIRVQSLLTPLKDQLKELSLFRNTEVDDKLGQALEGLINLTALDLRETSFDGESCHGRCMVLESSCCHALHCVPEGMLPLASIQGYDKVPCCAFVFLQTKALKSLPPWTT